MEHIKKFIIACLNSPVCKSDWPEMLLAEGGG